MGVIQTLTPGAYLLLLQVAFAQQISTLEKIKKTLEENLSAESKLANDLKKINDLMGEI